MKKTLMVMMGCCAILAACGDPNASANPLIEQAQLVGDEAPTPDYDMPVFTRETGKPQKFYVDNKGPGAEARKALRQAVLTASRGLKRAPCDEAAKMAYLQAFRDYAEAKVAMQHTQMSYQLYWTTRDDKAAVDTIDALYESGHITQGEQMQAMMGATAQGRLIASMSQAESGEMDIGPDGEPIKPACKNPKPSSAA